MATRITHFLHSNTVTGAQVLGTAFSAADVHIHDLSSGQAPIITNSRNWYGILEGIFIKLTSAGSPTTVTFSASEQPRQRQPLRLRSCGQRDRKPGHGSDHPVLE
jgi:hypothetical protein